MSVRFEEGQQVLRLFTTRGEAEKAIGARAGALSAKQHESGLGWLLVNEQSGQRYDDAGLIPEVVQKGTEDEQH